jgi:hypothetical protein
MKAAPRRNPVASNQNALHPQRMMTKDTKKDSDNTGQRVSQGRAVGITKKCSFDKATIQNTEVWDIAFFDQHGAYLREQNSSL